MEIIGPKCRERGCSKVMRLVLLVTSEEIRHEEPQIWLKRVSADTIWTGLLIEASRFVSNRLRGTHYSTFCGVDAYLRLLEPQKLSLHLPALTCTARPFLLRIDKHNGLGLLLPGRSDIPFNKLLA
ncbi:hypothetical protein MKZ38_008635 [Zalerion maritima]|uniref:Uncharacterized protein n=1 Tax=Zalerion maritima TaxID=339359 RepID=A0AAD5RZP3_9PEZI|nr:hypothetical protein MKZ38_008635 [Zalerion maritima]